METSVRWCRRPRRRGVAEGDDDIYWDQGSVLVQLGLIDPASLPVAGIESARKLLDPAVPSNQLIRRAEARRAAQSKPKPS